MELTKSNAKQVLQRIGDSLDGVPDGTFTLSDLVQRVASEAGRVAELPQRVERHPVEYFWKGALAGAFLGMAMWPVVQGVARVLSKALGL